MGKGGANVYLGMHWDPQKAFCILDLSSQERIGQYPRIKHEGSLYSVVQALSHI